jgi:tRNA A22 N-methylase
VYLALQIAISLVPGKTPPKMQTYAAIDIGSNSCRLKIARVQQHQLKVVVNSDAGSQWLGKITEFNRYRALVDWATRSMEAGRLLELPREFKAHFLQPWR